MKTQKTQRRKYGARLVPSGRRGFLFAVVLAGLGATQPMARAGLIISILEADDGGTIVRWGGSVTSIQGPDGVNGTSIVPVDGSSVGLNSPGYPANSTLTLGIPNDVIGSHSSGRNMWRNTNSGTEFRLQDYQDDREAVVDGTTYTPGGQAEFTLAEYPFSNISLAPGTYPLVVIFHAGYNSSYPDGPIDFGEVTLCIGQDCGVAAPEAGHTAAMLALGLFGVGFLGKRKGRKGRARC